MTPEEIVILASGVLMIVNTMLVSTSGFTYTMLFKILPFFLGLGCFWSIRHVFM